MVLAKISMFFGQHPFSSNVIFSIILVVLEKLIENGFICPCKSRYTEAVFCLYLLTPIFVTFSFGLCLIFSNEDWEKLRQTTCCWKFLSCLIPPVVWLAVFLVDGRYMSCLKTTIKVEYDDSEEKPLWKWCDKNQTLTDDQIHAWGSFYHSQFSGFGLFLLISILVLCNSCYKSCCKKQPRMDLSDEVPCCSAHGQTCGSAHCRTCCSEHNNIHCLAHPPRNEDSAPGNPDSGNPDSESSERNPLNHLKMEPRGNTTSNVGSPCATTSDVGLHWEHVERHYQLC